MSRPLPKRRAKSSKQSSITSVQAVGTASANSVTSITRSLGRHLETRPLVEGAAAAAVASSIPWWRCSHSTTTWGRYATGAGFSTSATSSPFLGSGPLATGRSSATWLWWFWCCWWGSGGTGVAAAAGDGEDEEWPSLDAMRSPNAIDACCACLPHPVTPQPRWGRGARSPTSIESGQRGESEVGSQISRGGESGRRLVGEGFRVRVWMQQLGGGRERQRGVGGEGKGSGVSVRGGRKQATPREIDRWKENKIAIKSRNGNGFFSFLLILLILGGLARGPCGPCPSSCFSVPFSLPLFFWRMRKYSFLQCLFSPGLSFWIVLIGPNSKLSI